DLNLLGDGDLRAGVHRPPLALDAAACEGCDEPRQQEPRAIRPPVHGSSSGSSRVPARPSGSHRAPYVTRIRRSRSTVAALAAAATAGPHASAAGEARQASHAGNLVFGGAN